MGGIDRTVLSRLEEIDKGESGFRSPRGNPRSNSEMIQDLLRGWGIDADISEAQFAMAKQDDIFTRSQVRLDLADIVDQLPGLPSGEKRAYRKLVQLAVHLGYAYPTQKRLAGMLGVCDRQTRKYIRTLKEFGLIRCTARPDLRGTIQYWLVRHPVFAELLCQRHRPSEAGPSGWWSNRIPELASELQRNRRIAPNFVEREVDVPLPDERLVRETASCFSTEAEFYGWLREVPRRVDTSKIRGYGWYLRDAQRHRKSAS